MTTTLKCDTHTHLHIHADHHGVCAQWAHERDRNGEKKTISDYILQHLFSPKIDLGYLMLPLNNILTFIHKVSLLNYWGRKRDLDFSFFGCFTCATHSKYSITSHGTRPFLFLSLSFRFVCSSFFTFCIHFVPHFVFHSLVHSLHTWNKMRRWCAVFGTSIREKRINAVFVLFCASKKRLRKYCGSV